MTSQTNFARGLDYLLKADSKATVEKVLNAVFVSRLEANPKVRLFL